MTAKINERQIVHQGSVFKLVKENVTLNNDVTTTMEYIEHPGATAIIPLLSKRRVLLLKQYRHALKDYIWEIPAGTMDDGESALGCAKRELVEETGYAAQHWQNLGVITPVPGYSDERIHMFLATKLTPVAQDMDQDEIIRVYEVQFDEAIGMIKSGQLTDAKSIAGLFLASSRLSYLNFCQHN